MKEKICKCGGKIILDNSLIDGFIVSCMKCDKCNDVLFTPEQTRELIKLREANEDIEAERKIIKVGSSIAALLPKKVEKHGIKEGDVDNIRILSQHSLEIKFKKNLI